LGGDAKGYKRAHFEELWAGYLSGQNPSPQPDPTFKASNRPNADGMGITRDFQSVQKELPDALKNANLSHSHAGLDAWTVRNDESGAESDSATASTPLNTVNGQPDRERAPPTTNGHRPPRGKGWQLVGDQPKASARVWLKEVWPPALGPAGDDTFDIETGWRQ
jgi:hypothetical protein